MASADEYLTKEQLPGFWREDPSQASVRLDDVLVASSLMRFEVIAFWPIPVIPEATQKIWEQLGQPGKLADVQRIDQVDGGYD